MSDNFSTMRYFGKTKANLITFVAALIITLGVRYFVFTPDSNLLIVSVTFILAYTTIFLCTTILCRLKAKSRQ